MKFLPLICVALIAGCSLVPSEQTNKQTAQSTAAIQASHETELTKRINGAAVPITVSQTGSNSLVLNLPEQKTTTTVKDATDASSTSHSRQSDDSTNSIPMGVKLLLLGLGILVLGMAVKVVVSYLRANSAAVSAALDAGDQSLANVISHIEAKRAAASDPATQAQLNDLLAQAEKSRGKLSSQA